MTAATQSRARPGYKMALLAFCMLIYSIDYNIVYLALPEIGEKVGFTAQSLQWVVSAYAVGLGGFLLLGGRAVDRLGGRRMLMLALLLYALASLAGGLAPSPEILVGARAVQGLGGALLFPATLALINTSFEEGPERNRAYALWGTAGASGVIVGAMAGGLLTNFLGWEWVFFVNVPLCAIAIIGALQLLARDAVRGEAGGSFDIPGALLATAGSTLLVFGLITGPEAGWQSPRTVSTLVSGLVLLALFFVVERFTRDPLAPLRMFTVRSLIAAIAIIFIFQGVINTLHYLYFIDLQTVLNYTPLQAGLAFLPMSFFAMFGSGKVLPLLLNRWGVRTALFVGMLGVGTAMVVYAGSMSLDGPYWTLLPAVILWGLSAGMLYPAMFAAASAGVAPNEQGVASALAQTSAQIGGAIGLAALVAVANAGLDLSPGATNSPADVLAGLRMSSFVGGLVAIAGAFISFVIKTPAGAPAQEAAVQAADPAVATGQPGTAD